MSVTGQIYIFIFICNEVFVHQRGPSCTKESATPTSEQKDRGKSDTAVLTFDIPIIILIFAEIYRNTNSMNHSSLTPYESIASLGASFAKYRKSLKVSQQRLHEKTGISIFTISQFENGKGQGLSLSHFLLLLDAVGLDISLTNLIPIASVIDPEKIWKAQNRKGGRK